MLSSLILLIPLVLLLPLLWWIGRPRLMVSLVILIVAGSVGMSFCQPCRQYLWTEFCSASIRYFVAVTPKATLNACLRTLPPASRLPERGG